MHEMCLVIENEFEIYRGTDTVVSRTTHFAYFKGPPLYSVCCFIR